MKQPVSKPAVKKAGGKPVNPPMKIDTPKAMKAAAGNNGGMKPGKKGC